ncbi:hypothetical protein N7G274_000858 [Stereocaulon virgatum]|uniref:Uncharacterized protein n=1 Tax=Stereocaulon virgatum TaxID=373712 RepID=A0ABR4AN04_9LECA
MVRERLLELIVQNPYHQRPNKVAVECHGVYARHTTERRSRRCGDWNCGDGNEISLESIQIFDMKEGSGYGSNRPLWVIGGLVTHQWGFWRILDGFVNIRRYRNLDLIAQADGMNHLTKEKRPRKKYGSYG